MILRADTPIPVQNLPRLDRPLDRPTLVRMSEPAIPHVQVASTLPQVVACWQLVYEVYLRSGFIYPNAFGIHPAFPR